MRTTELTRVRLPVCLFGITLASLAQSAGVQSEYSEEGAVACIECHETPYVMGILDTVHARIADPRTPAAQKECQSCHGPSATHMRFPMQVANVHFGKNCEHEPETQNKLCLQCHKDSDFGEWSASAHGYEQIVCSRCHSMHDPDRIVPTKTTVSVGCTDSCHKEVREIDSASEFSHAIGRDLDGKGELTCAGCHNPHGPLSSERCLGCHAQTPEVLAKESDKARRYHETASAKGTDCIRCHKAISHPIRALTLDEGG